MKTLIVAVALVSLAACGPTDPTSIDGIAVEPEVRCAQNDASCQALLLGIRTATEEKLFVAQRPAVEVHAYLRTQQFETSGGTFYVATLTLRDGIHETFNVTCGFGVEPPDHCSAASTDIPFP
jgi:hypothetical protein